MPIGLPAYQVHCSRIGSVIVSLCTLIVPFMLKSLATACFKEYEADDDHYTSSADPQGISIMKGLVITSLIILTAFLVALGSLDPNREATYAKLEEDAFYHQTKHHLEVHSSEHQRASAVLTATNSVVVDMQQQKEEEVAMTTGEGVELSRSVNSANDDSASIASFDTIKALKHAK
jgi:hypothetical protein